MSEINILVNKQYGKWLFYPDCENARRFTQLTGKQTLTSRDIEIIKTLGFAVNQRIELVL